MSIEINAVVGDITRIEAGAIIVNYFEGMGRLEGDIVAVDGVLWATRHNKGPGVLLMWLP